MKLSGNAQGVAFPRKAQWHPLLVSLFVGLGMIASLFARSYHWSTLAGSDGGTGFQDGVVGEAKFFQPAAVAFDVAGNMWICESGNHVLRRVSLEGQVSTPAGLGGMAGAQDGMGEAARFHSPGALVIRPDGVVIVCDTGNHTLRWMEASGELRTLAGVAGKAGLADGEASEARFFSPSGLALAPDGGVFVADTGNHAIRHVSPNGRTRTVAGWEGLPGHQDGEPALARFRSPLGLALEADGSLLVADSDNAVIRRISPAGSVSTPAGLPYGYDHADGVGEEAKFVYPVGLAVAGDGMIYVSDPGAEAIRRIHPVTHEVITLAGEVGGSGFADGSPGRFSFPAGLAVDGQGRLCVADMENHAIRTVDSDGQVGTLVASPPNHAGSQDGPAGEARFRVPYGMAIGPDGRVFVADTGNRTVRVISSAGEVRTLAGGTGQIGTTDGPAGVARFTSPRGVTVSPGGRLHVADWNASAGTIRRIEPDGTVSTLAGAPGTLPPEESLHSLSGVTTLPDGSLAATDISAIRLIRPTGETSFLAGSKRFIVQSGSQTITSWRSGSRDGQGLQATFFHPHGVVADPQGVLYVTEFSGCVIRKITPQGQASTLAGSPARAGATLEHRDGTGAEARFHRPAGIALDLAGNLFVADSGSHTIRMVDPSGKVRTIGGLPGRSGNNSGPGNRALFRSPFGIAVDEAGRLYVADRDNHRIVLGVPLPYPEIQIRDQAGRDLSPPETWLDFGPAPIGQAGEIQVVRITNQGTADLRISTPELLGEDADGFLLPSVASSIVLAPGGFRDLPIQVVPGPPGLRTARLFFTSNDETSPSLFVNLRAGLNRAPVFPGYQVSFPIGTPIAIPMVKILARAHDPDGDALRISAVGPPEKGVDHSSLVDGTIQVNFSPAAAQSPGEFTLPVTVSDAHNALATGPLVIRLIDPSGDSVAAIARNPPRIEWLPDNHARVSFHGIPGRAYRIERSTDLLHWFFLAEIRADERGGIQLIDPSPPQPAAYYRIAPP